ncbi:MAG: hypothetical protein ACI8UO_006439 [Verrucomicrobiales bacterium]|jgi:hypothetical protein
MIANTEMTIIEEVRAFKEANAAQHDFDISRIIAAARQRQESSDRKIIRQGEQWVAGDGGDVIPVNENQPRGA